MDASGRADRTIRHVTESERIAKTPAAVQAAHITKRGQYGVAVIGLLGLLLTTFLSQRQPKQQMTVANSPGSTNTLVKPEMSVTNSPGSTNTQVNVNSPIPRVIAGAVKEDMVNILKSAPTGSKVRIDVGSDTESRRLAKYIQEIFKMSGWDASIMNALDQDFEKVSMRVRDIEHAPLRAVQVRRALERAGFGVQVFADQRIDADEIRICVGPA